MVDWENAPDEFFHRLRAAIIKQAVEDWRGLTKIKIRRGCDFCRNEGMIDAIQLDRCPACGQKIDEIDERDCNYRDLIHFFKHDCDKLLTGTGLTADRIYRRLRQEGKID
jgi:hypothetical protein